MPGDTHGYDWDGTGIYRVLDDGSWGTRMLRVLPQ
jgi:hypothetical protein